MWKRVFILLFIVDLSTAWADNCYSIALWSVPVSLYKENSVRPADNTCKILNIDGHVTERCGCYDDPQEADMVIDGFLKRYATAYVTTTRRARFSSSDEVETSDTTEIIEAPHPFDLSMLMQTDVKEQRPKALQERLKENSQNKDQLIADRSDIFGFHLHGKYGQYIQQDYILRDFTDFEYDVQLKFEFFKDGYFERKKIKRRVAQASRLRYFQDLTTLQKNDYDDISLKIDALKSEITMHYYQESSAIYLDAIVQKKEELEQSLTTRYALTELLQKRHRFIHTAKIYERHDRSGIDSGLYRLLQEIEHLPLIELARIKEHAMEYNTDLRIEDSRMRLLDIDRSYTDNVKMNLFVNRREVDELGWYHTIGAEADIPIDFSVGEEQRLVKLEQQSHQIRQESFSRTLSHRLDSLYRTFIDLQALIEIDKDDVSFLNIRIKEFQAIKDNAIAKLDFDPDEEILAGKHETLDLKFELLLKRVELFSILNEIAYISNIPNIEHLVKE